MSENLRFLGKYSAAMESGDTEAVYEFFSPDFHSQSVIASASRAAPTPGSENSSGGTTCAALPDMTFSVDLLIEQGDLVVSNWTVRGTHTGTAFYDVPPSGKPVIINGTAILRIVDDQIVEHWGGPHCQEGLGLVK